MAPGSQSACRRAGACSSGTANSDSVPGLGMNPRATSSALSRHSIAWPSNDDVLLREAERLSVGDLELERDEIAAGDRLGDRVLDLDPAVDLEEEVLAGVGIEHELDRAEVAVADRARERDRRRGRARCGSAASSVGAGASSITF